jgi:hypothetical protein
VAAAAEQRPDLRGTAAGYLADRLRVGIGLTALVLHRDLLVLPDGDRASSRGTDRPADAPVRTGGATPSPGGTGEPHGRGPA